MTIQNDGSDQAYVDTPTLVNEHIRATLIRASRAGYGVDSIRLQIRDAGGHLRQGPEIPLSSVPDLLKALAELVLQR